MTSFNAAAARKQLTRAGRALGCAADEVATVLFDLADTIGAPTALRDLSLPRDKLGEVASSTVRTGVENPRPLDVAGVHELLVAAYEGRRP